MAIVSREPLATGELAAPQAGAAQPFKSLNEADVQVLYERLASLGDDDWRTAQLWFDVVD